MGLFIIFLTILFLYRCFSFQQHHWKFFILNHAFEIARSHVFWGVFVVFLSSDQQRIHDDFFCLDFDIIISQVQKFGHKKLISKINFVWEILSILLKKGFRREIALVVELKCDSLQMNFFIFPKSRQKTSANQTFTCLKYIKEKKIWEINVYLQDHDSFLLTLLWIFHHVLHILTPFDDFFF